MMCKLMTWRYFYFSNFKTSRPKLPCEAHRWPPWGQKYALTPNTLFFKTPNNDNNVAMYSPAGWNTDHRGSRHHEILKQFFYLIILLANFVGHQLSLIIPACPVQSFR